MSSSNRESSDDLNNHQSHEEIIEMKSLFKMLLESQNKQAESLAKLADTQANTQQQIIQILKSTNGDGNKQKQKGEDSSSSSGAGKEEIAEVPDDDDEEEPELGNDRLSGEMTEIKELLKVLIQSQAKQAESQHKLADAQARQIESQEKLAKSQENIQHQMLEVLRSISNAGNNNKQQGTIKNNIAHSNEMTKTSSSGEITEASGSGTTSEEKQPSEAEEKVVRAIYKPDRDDLLVKGDCEKTIEFLKNNHEALTHGVTRGSYTVLHLAISKRREMVLIAKIVELMSPELLEYQAGEYNYTALHSAAQDGNFAAVVLLVKKNPRLPQIPDKRGLTPLDIALYHNSIDQKEIVEYLYSMTKDVDPTRFTGEHGAFTLCKLIECNFYGELALYLS
ncbi:hypothetical protein MKX01_031413 [Papaver californicum]|nr:hypothetical protein MKX01_031413 [Papaver californicum]